MNTKLAKKISAELEALNDEWEAIAEHELFTAEQEARSQYIIDRERELKAMLRDARANNSKGHTARLISENRD